ncbi:MAG: carboxypeptidase-like regulatory domain-containing protein [Chloroflexota bacterium]
MKKLVSLVLLALFLVACGPSPADIGTSGIEGQVVLGECQGNQIGMECFETQPYQAIIVVLDQTGQEVTSFETDEDGAFRVALDPGTYILHPTSPGPFPVALDRIVTIVEGGFVEINILYDSGVR